MNSKQTVYDMNDFGHFLAKGFSCLQKLREIFCLTVIFRVSGVVPEWGSRKAALRTDAGTTCDTWNIMRNLFICLLFDTLGEQPVVAVQSNEVFIIVSRLKLRRAQTSMPLYQWIYWMKTILWCKSIISYTRRKRNWMLRNVLSKCQYWCAANICKTLFYFHITYFRTDYCFTKWFVDWVPPLHRHCTAPLANVTEIKFVFRNFDF